jgi:hypothetical protein
MAIMEGHDLLFSGVPILNAEPFVVAHLQLDSCSEPTMQYQAIFASSIEN